MKRRQLLNQQSTGRWLALFIVAFMMPLALWAQQDYGITVGGPARMHQASPVKTLRLVRCRSMQRIIL